MWEGYPRAQSVDDRSNWLDPVSICEIESPSDPDDKAGTGPHHDPDQALSHRFHEFWPISDRGSSLLESPDPNGFAISTKMPFM
jgi:hypothetical protein